MTGYTSMLLEKNQTFEQFALSCARAFGALVQMRDDPMDAPIPESFPVGSYYKDKLKAGIALLARVQEMTDAEQEAACNEEYAKYVQGITEMNETAAKNTARLNETLAQVRAWVPPTEKHVELKKFMVQQIEESLRYETPTTISPQQPVAVWFLGYLKRCVRDVQYSTESMENEATSCATRTKWVQDLRRSLVPG